MIEIYHASIHSFVSDRLTRGSDLEHLCRWLIKTLLSVRSALRVQFLHSCWKSLRTSSLSSCLHWEPSCSCVHPLELDWSCDFRWSQSVWRRTIIASICSVSSTLWCFQVQASSSTRALSLLYSVDFASSWSFSWLHSVSSLSTSAPWFPHSDDSWQQYWHHYKSLPPDNKMSDLLCLLLFFPQLFLQFLYLTETP